MIEGRLKLAFAHTEVGARYDLARVAATAKKAGKVWVIDGEKRVVLGAPMADKLVVSARTSGKPADAKGISLFLVDRTAAGVTVQGYRTIDGMRAAEIKFANVKLDADGVLGEVDQGLPLLERGADFAVSALCAEAVGAMEALNAATFEYLKTRQQFGNIPFQVVVGRNADGVFHAPLLQCFVNLRLGKGGICSKRDFLSRLLLSLGADPAIHDARFDSTPLGWARHFGREETITLLAPLTP